MNKDQIMQFADQLRNMSFYNLERSEIECEVNEIVAKLNSLQEKLSVQQVPITERHVGCVVELSAHREHWQKEFLYDVDIDDGFEGSSAYWRYARFSEIYRIPITHRWSGGECPVRQDADVLVEFRSGRIVLKPANFLDWAHYGERDDIIGYTVLDVIGVEDES